MSSNIYKDILMLKERYHNSNNSFKIIKQISENDFEKKMKFFIDNYKENIKNIDIIDSKNYYDYNKILKIYDNGNMSSFIIKKLKYINYNNHKLELFNKREISINNFNFKQNYDKITKMKKILFNDKYNNIIEFIVSMEESDNNKNDNKIKKFYINIITLSSNISNNIINIIDLLNKND